MVKSDKEKARKACKHLGSVIIYSRGSSGMNPVTQKKRGRTMRRCLIIAGGEYAPIGPMREGDFVIACDRGCGYAAREGITPDLIIGDFDSYSGALPENVPVERLPVEKDDTDTMHAVKFAIARGFDEVRLCCALGGSLDHLLANLQTLHYAAAAGLRATAGDERTEIMVCTPGDYRIEAREGWYLSLFALTDEVAGLTIRGAKYTLTDAVMSSGFPIGVSNEFKGDAEISFRSGVAAVILCKRGA